MPANEKLLERKLVAAVKKAGGEAVKLNSMSHNGLPDRMALLPGGLIRFVEVKSTGKKPRPVQEAMIARLRALGFRVWVVDSLDTLSEFTERF